MFTVLQGGGPSQAATGFQSQNKEDLKKDYDASIKGNVFTLEGHKLQLPAVNDKTKLEIVHRYLVL